MKISFSNFPQNMDEKAIESLFLAFGTVTHFHLKRDKKTKVSFGYGTLEMEDSSGEKAIQGLHGTEKEGKKLSVQDSEKLAKEFQDKNPIRAGGANPATKVHARSGAGLGGAGGGGAMRRGGNRGS